MSSNEKMRRFDEQTREIRATMERSMTEIANHQNDLLMALLAENARTVNQGFTTLRKHMLDSIMGEGPSQQDMAAGPSAPHRANPGMAERRRPLTPPAQNRMGPGRQNHRTKPWQKNNCWKGRSFSRFSSIINEDQGTRLMSGNTTHIIE